MGDAIGVEVVFAMPHEQKIATLSLAADSTVADAIDASDFARVFSGVDLSTLDVGIWGHICERHTLLADGDRVEIYRELEIDPREMRRQLAQAGKTMAAAGTPGKGV